MDLPITRPSMMCYADELKFPDLLNDLSSKKHNGFIRITSGSEEGFILFKEGKEIAASYVRYSRVDAIEKIKSAMEDKTTLIEVFDVRPNQIDFFMDMNKPYLIGSDAYELIDKFKKPEEEKKEPKPKAVPKPKPVSSALKESKPEPVIERIEEPKISKPQENIVQSQDKTSNESKSISETGTIKQPINQIDNDQTVKEEVPSIDKIETIKEPVTENEPVNEEITETESVDKPIPKLDTEIVKKIPEIKESEVSTEKPTPPYFKFTRITSKRYRITITGGYCKTIYG